MNHQVLVRCSSCRVVAMNCFKWSCNQLTDQFISLKQLIVLEKVQIICMMWLFFHDHVTVVARHGVLKVTTPAPCFTRRLRPVFLAWL